MCHTQTQPSSPTSNGYSYGCSWLRNPENNIFGEMSIRNPALKNTYYLFTMITLLASFSYYNLKELPILKEGSITDKMLTDLIPIITIITLVAEKIVDQNISKKK